MSRNAAGNFSKKCFFVFTKFGIGVNSIKTQHCVWWCIPHCTVRHVLISCIIITQQWPESCIIYNWRKEKSTKKCHLPPPFMYSFIFENRKFLFVSLCRPLCMTMFVNFLCKVCSLGVFIIWILCTCDFPRHFQLSRKHVLPLFKISGRQFLTFYAYLAKKMYTFCPFISRDRSDLTIFFWKGLVTLHVFFCKKKDKAKESGWTIANKFRPWMMHAKNGLISMKVFFLEFDITY